MRTERMSELTTPMAAREEETPGICETISSVQVLTKSVRKLKRMRLSRQLELRTPKPQARTEPDMQATV